MKLDQSVVTIQMINLRYRPRMPAEIAAKMAEKMTVADIAKVFQARAFICGFGYAG